jgi:hypothetical protein
MLRSFWLAAMGTLLIMGCTAAPPPASAPPVQVSTSGVVADESAAGETTPMAVCTPGDSRACCPFPQGCSCLGDQTCLANGTWGRCLGAGRAGQPCP